jgi:hypothetical protein
MYPECRHIMPSGAKCHALALGGKSYCYYHTRLHTFATRPDPSPLDNLKIPVLEDRSAIQLALAHVLDALGSSRLDAKRAGLYLYALQIALQSVQQPSTIHPRSVVPSMTVSPAGEELGPEDFSCPSHGDCSRCGLGEACEDYEPDDEEDDEEE